MRRREPCDAVLTSADLDEPSTRRERSRRARAINLDPHAGRDRDRGRLEFQADLQAQKVKPDPFGVSLLREFPATSSERWPC